MSLPQVSTVPRSLRLLLPKEHGAWAFLLLPMVTGLLVAPSWAGVAVALGAVAAFLSRGPFLAGREGLPSFLLLAALSLILLGGGVWQGGRVTFSALAVAAVLGLPLMGRSLKEMRNLLSEGLALMACGALLPAILGADGVPPQEAFRGWWLLLLLALPPLVQLRHRLAQSRQGAAPRRSAPALGLQVAAAALAGLLWQAGRIPGVLPFWLLLLLMRGCFPHPASPQRLGWTEAAVSLGHLGVLWFALAGR